MSWPFNFNYQHPQHFQNSLNPFQNQLLLHSLTQDPLIQAYSSQLMGFSAQYAPFSSFSFHSQISSFTPCHDLNNICRQLPNIQSVKANLKKQQSLSILIDESDSSENKGLEAQRCSDGKGINKPKKFISHNCSLRNDTKNIPKNYGKATLSYIQKNTRVVKQILARYEVDYMEFMIFIKSFKQKINTIHDLREMWGQSEPQNKLKKCIRILSYNFMRKKCIPYIYNSRIKNYHTHIKYRKKIMQGIKNPENFTKIKQF